MIKLTTIYFCSFFLLLSCSSDSADEIIETTPIDEKVIIDPSENSITLDGEEFVFTQTNVTRSGDRFILTLSNEQSEAISIPFHKKGNYGDIAYIQLTEGTPESFRTLYTNPDRDFSFEVLNIDEANNSVSIKLAGILHKDGDLFKNNTAPFELTEQITLSGSLNLDYTIVTPTFEGLEVSAFIDNEEWHSLKSGSTTVGFDSPDSITTFFHDNNTTFSINLVLSKADIVPGTYTFDQSSEGIYRLFLSESIIEEDGFENSIEYLSEGTLTITSFESTVSFGTIRAEFSFTATHPDTGDEIDVNSGVFNDVFFL